MKQIFVVLIGLMIGGCAKYDEVQPDAGKGNDYRPGVYSGMITVGGVEMIAERTISISDSSMMISWNQEQANCSNVSQDSDSLKYMITFRNTDYQTGESELYVFDTRATISGDTLKETGKAYRTIYTSNGKMKKQETLSFESVTIWNRYK